MNSTEQLLPAPAQREQLIARVRALTVACPFSQDNPPDCPLCNIRKLSLKARIVWVNSLAPEVMEGLLQFHADCLYAKEHHAVPPHEVRCG
ncbi:MAG: hypothetical protein HYV95_07155 [Opitutae bacterium]|nr:hypothetical protein [Opitutae bacterium]